MSSASALHPAALEIETGPHVDASIIWLHGLGVDGHDFEPLVPELALPPELAVRFVFPHAPQRAVTINGGAIMRAWYDIMPAAAGFEGNADHIRESADSLKQLIEREARRGIRYERIVVAGFSQGGAIALHVGLRHTPRLAGILALSTYVPLPDTLSQEMPATNHGLPVFMAHGQYDPLIALSWAEQSKELLLQQDLNVEWRVYVMEHSVHPQEIEDISVWLTQLLSTT